MDHSAFDAYALLIEADGQRLLYSGDFRAHGRKAWAFDAFLSDPPASVDVLLMEGTVLGREDSPAPLTEDQVEADIAASIADTNGIVLACFSAQNIDRLVTFYRATLRSGIRMKAFGIGGAQRISTGNADIPVWHNHSIDDEEARLALRLALWIEQNHLFQAPMSLVLASLSLFGLGIFGPSIASGLVSGAPQLGAGAAFGAAAGAAGITMVAGGAAAGGARALGGAALGAVRSGTAMGSAASTAYGLGQEAGNSAVGAGLSEVAKAAGNAGRAKASEALGLSEAASRGRQAAWNALNDTNPSPAQAQAGGGSEAAPAWARAMRAEQSTRHRRQLALHALQQGDRGGGAANPDIKERND